MKEEAYDIVHSHELFHSGIVLLTAYLAGVNGRFCHAHNWKDSSGDGKKRSFIRSVYNYVMQAFIRKFSTHMLACSTYAGQFLYGEKVAQDKRFHLLFNSVDTHKFLDRQSESITDEFCDNWTNVLNVGRVTTVKNQIFLTKIAAVLKARSKKIRILCAGSGDDDYMNALNTIISEASLESHIKLLGPRDDVSELMKKSSAFVLPSHYEGMPLVIIEAQSAGLPCVCADTFSHEVDFGLNQIQWLPLECTPETWADAIENACSCSKANVQDIQHVIEEKGFDSNTFAQMLCSLYKSSLEGMNT